MKSLFALALIVLGPMNSKAFAGDAPIVRCHIGQTAELLDRWMFLATGKSVENAFSFEYKSFDLPIEQGLVFFDDAPPEEVAKRVVTYTKDNQTLEFLTNMNSLRISGYTLDQSGKRSPMPVVYSIYKKIDGLAANGGFTGFVNFGGLAYVCYQLLPTCSKQTCP